MLCVKLLPVSCAVSEVRPTVNHPRREQFISFVQEISSWNGGGIAVGTAVGRAVGTDCGIFRNG